MKILNLFKKLIKKEKVQLVQEKLTFSEIEKWLEEKQNQNQDKENQILILVKDKIKDFNSDLTKKIIILNEFDLESKKAEDKIKEIVYDSREKYIEAVHNLMANLESLRETKFSELTKKIDKTFLDFNKTSFKNYERATILIGKEMANIKSGFKTFSKDLLEIFNNNKEIAELFQKIELIKLKLNSSNYIKEDLIKINKTIETIDEKIQEKEKENQKLLEEIKEIKQGEDYKNMLEKKEKINTLEKESKKDILDLKQFLDFKALANFFHINQEQMNILKNHKENFHANFEKDDGKSIIDLLEESKLNTNEILEKVNLIRSKIQETSDFKKEIKKDETQELHYKIKQTIIEVDNLKIEKTKHEKRNQKLNINKQELIDSLKQELAKLNVEVV